MFLVISDMTCLTFCSEKLKVGRINYFVEARPIVQGCYRYCSGICVYRGRGRSTELFRSYRQQGMFCLYALRLFRSP